jgi:hypothetical protein
MRENCTKLRIDIGKSESYMVKSAKKEWKSAEMDLCEYDG